MRPVAKTDKSDASNERESWWIRIALVLHWACGECQQLDIIHPSYRELHTLSITRVVLVQYDIHYDTLPLRLCRLVFPGGEHSRARDIVIKARFIEVSKAEWTSITAGKSKRFRSCNNQASLPPTTRDTQTNTGGIISRSYQFENLIGDALFGR